MADMPAKQYAFTWRPDHEEAEDGNTQSPSDDHHLLYDESDDENESKGDHRIAMTACVLALLADGPSKIRDADCIATSFPRFVGTFRALGARIDVDAAG